MALKVIMSWFRQYRPTTIQGLHLTSVRTTFAELMKNGRLPQVMLFAGSKGTGKTSTARIIAALVNDPANHLVVQQNFFTTSRDQASTYPNASYQEPDQNHPLVQQIQKGSSLVVQELDAASNRGIDEVRQLKERLALPPQEGLMTVYILDEAHMLTTEAFNALLKVMEEPPAHVIFILATTELHKIPATIVSRCTVIQFTKATTAETSQAIRAILETEKLPFEEAALQLIAQQADGSFRDAVKLAELVAQESGHITVEAVNRLGTASLSTQVKTLIQAVIAKDAVQVSNLCQEMREASIDATYLTKTLHHYLHEAILHGLGVLPGESELPLKVATFLLNELVQIPATATSPIPLLPLELKLLDIIFRAQQKNSPNSNSSTNTNSGRSSTTATIPTSSAVSSPPVSAAPAATPTLTASLSEETSFVTPLHSLGNGLQSDNLAVPTLGDATTLVEKWREIVDGVKDKNSSVAAILGAAQPQVTDTGTAVVQVYYKFHQEQLRQPKFKRLLEEAMATVLGGRVDVEFVLAQGSMPATTPEASASGAATVALAAEVLV